MPSACALSGGRVRRGGLWPLCMILVFSGCSSGPALRASVMRWASISVYWFSGPACKRMSSA
eukprot:554157-Pyramimonas_sp.AAC.1